MKNSSKWPKTGNCHGASMLTLLWYAAYQQDISFFYQSSEKIEIGLRILRPSKLPNSSISGCYIRNQVLTSRHTSNLEERTDGKVVYHVKGLAGHVQVLFHLRTHHGCIAMWDLAIIHGSMHENQYPSNQNSKLCMRRNQTCGHQLQAWLLTKDKLWLKPIEGLWTISGQIVQLHQTCRMHLRNPHGHDLILLSFAVCIICGQLLLL